MMLHEGALTSDEQFPVITSGETVCQLMTRCLFNAGCSMALFPRAILT